MNLSDILYRLVKTVGPKGVPEVWLEPILTSINEQIPKSERVSAAMSLLVLVPKSGVTKEVRKELAEYIKAELVAASK